MKPHEGVILLLLIAAAGWLFAPAVHGGELGNDTACIQTAIKHLLKTAPGRKLARNEEMQAELATDVFNASRAYSVPPLLTLAIAFRESSLKSKTKDGKIGERGLMQVHGFAAKGCDLSTQIGQLNCGVKHLRHCYNRCKTGWIGAFTAYASGSCTPRTPRTKEVARQRLLLWSKLEGVTK